MIVCATDFSPGAEVATTIAADMAARLKTPLALVHVLDGRAAAVELEDAQRAAIRDRLAREAVRLHERGASVAEHLVDGMPDEQIVATAERLGARMIVVGALGYRSPGRWLVGSIAERVAQTSAVPVVVARWRDRLHAWARGVGALRVLIGHDGSARDDALFRWAVALRAIGPCEVVVGHIYFPPAEHHRLHVPAPIEVGAANPEIARVLTAELSGRYRQVDDGIAPTFCVEPGLGAPAYQIVELAERERADLIVVGAHQRHGLDRLWHGSVSHGVLRLAGVTVACVPRE